MSKRRRFGIGEWYGKNFLKIGPSNRQELARLQVHKAPQRKNNALGKMEDVQDISNADIAWFIVSYNEEKDPIQIVRQSVCFTTLERAVESLTGGVPVSLRQFETRIRQKVERLSLATLRKPDLAQ